MQYPERYIATITTDADGDATGYLPANAASGEINCIFHDYVDYTSGVADVTITKESSAEAILTLTNVTADSTTYPGVTTSGTKSDVPIVLANDRIKIVIASGGNVKSGIFHLTMT